MQCRFDPWRLLGLPIAALLAWGSASVAVAQNESAAPPPSPLFSTDEPLRLRLEAPMSEVMRDREDAEYRRGRLLYADANGTEAAIDLRVRVRGRSRAANCAFPPLLLNFPAEGLAGTTFEGQNRLKLVTHCESSDAYESYNAMEYLLYRVLNLLTDTSLRARVVEITYYDSERSREVATKPGFLIEDEEMFAARNGLELVTADRVDRAGYDQSALGLVEVFEYFIGNTDWSAVTGPEGEACCHNVVAMTRSDGRLVPIPYDFDSAGIINAPHAVTADSLPIRSVRERLYRGVCRDLAELQASFEPLQRHRAEITALFEREARLDERLVKNTLSYIDEFYEVLADPEEVQQEFRSGCRD